MTTGANVSFLPFQLGKNLLYKNAELVFKPGKTTPPSLLTEAELISLMDKFGIGTDATIHEHIKNIQERGYAIQSGSLFKPTLAGSALIKAYRKIGVELYKPYLRAAMEKDMRAVCDGKKKYLSTYNNIKKEMEKIFDTVYKNIPVMTDFLKKYVGEDKSPKIKNENAIELNIDCISCKTNKLRLIRNMFHETYFVGCSGFPSCKSLIGINDPIIIVETDVVCSECNNKKFELEFKNKNEKELRCLSTCLISDKNIAVKNPEKDKLRRKTVNYAKKTSNASNDENIKNYPTKAKSSPTNKKKCPVCQIEGPRPKNTNCAGIKRKANKPEDFLV